MNRRRILFVHTDRNRLERLGNALEGEFEALTASSWEVAWPLLSRHMVEMVVVEGEGVARLRELERRAPRVMRVLLVNEHARNELAQATEEGHLFVALPEAEEPGSLVRQIRALFSPRTGQRHWTEGDVTVQLGDTRRSPPPRYPVLDISSRGLAFFLASGERMEPLLVGASLSNLSIWRGEQELLAGGQGVVRHLEPVILGARGSPPTGERAPDTLASAEEFREGCRVGVEFMRSVRRGVPGGREVIRDLLPRIALLREAFQTGKGRAELADDPEIAFVVRGGEVDPLLEMVLLEGDRTAPFPLGAVIQVSFELGGTTYSFLSSVLPESAWQLPRTSRRRGARVLVLKLPGALRVGRRRRPARFQPSPQQGLEVDLASVLGEATVRRPVLDIGCTGLAFAASDRDVLPVGTVIPRLEISLPTGARLRTAGRVANLVPLVHGGADDPWRLRCGIQFEGLSPPDRARLEEIILQAGFPGLSDAQGTPFRDIWAFLQEAGFLYPEKLRRIAPLLPEIERTMSTLIERPNHLFKTLLYRRQQAILGHVSMVRAYCNTWIIQHLAATKSEIGRLAAARLLVLGIAEHADRDPEVEWVRIYFRPDNKWPARVFGRFARQVFAPEISDLRTYSYLTAPAGGTVVAPPGVELRPPTPAERVEIEEHLVLAERPIMVRAGDLCRDSLTLDTLSTSYREFGLERRREALVAVRGGRLLGFALLEIASPGLNFSELTNAFTVHLVEQEPEVLTLLAARARQRYAELGRGWCIALAGEQDVPHLHAAGFSWSKDYCCWTMHRSLYRRFYEYLHHLYQRSRAVQ